MDIFCILSQYMFHLYYFRREAESYMANAFLKLIHSCWTDKFPATTETHFLQKRRKKNKIKKNLEALQFHSITSRQFNEASFTLRLKNKQATPALPLPKESSCPSSDNKKKIEGGGREEENCFNTY